MSKIVTSTMFDKIRVTLILLFIVKGSLGVELSNISFPASFLFGSGSSAYQIEGAWNYSDKGENVWDEYSHTYRYVIDGSTGDIACDSFNKYEQDIALLKQLKVNYYKFSISWSRILPSGFVNQVSEVGVQYYGKLIDMLLEEGIEPWVEMYHWDTPVTLRHLGSWNNPNTVDYMTHLADLLFSRYGDRVKTWLTFNDPLSFCADQPNSFSTNYGESWATGVTEYKCGHNVLKAHAKIYRLYQNNYKEEQKGRIALPLGFEFHLPATNSEVDIEAAERKNLFDFGWFAYPLLHGQYPPVMTNIVTNHSTLQGYTFTRLPNFTATETEELRGAYDFFAINHYSSYLTLDVERPEPGAVSFYTDDGVETYKNSSWGNSSLDWLKVYPEGFRQMLVYVKNNYDNPEIVITGQGFADNKSSLNDVDRINYHQLYLSEALKAIYEDGVNLTAYTVRSLMDSFEWQNGYTVGFGLYHVDFDSSNRTRTPKESASFFRNLIESRCLVDICENRETSNSANIVNISLYYVIMFIMYAYGLHIIK